MISLNLLELRKRRGITQSYLAEVIGVSFQTISKWETGAALPDIRYIVSLAKFFEVSTDQLLGLKPLEQEYFSRMTESAEYWNQQLEYMRSSREQLWNSDYMQFLVQNVWKIEEKVDILDMGCGNGYLARLILPFLPEGSTYTGVDISDVMIKDAQHTYAEQNENIKFICGDGYNYHQPEAYDMVICQAFLRELSSPEKALENMLLSLKKEGLIVCVEVDRELDNAGTYIEGLDYALLLNTEIQREYWKKEYEQGDRDYAIGIRLPFMLRELGVKQIEVRNHDKVKFANPSNVDEYETLRKAYISEKGWDKNSMLDDKKAVEVFMNRGLSREEAEHFVKNSHQMKEKIVKERKAFLKSTGFLITYGRKG